MGSVGSSDLLQPRTHGPGERRAKLPQAVPKVISAHAGDGAEQWELTCAAGWADGHADAPACAALRGCAPHGAAPPLRCEPGEAPGAEDATFIHGGGRHQAAVAVLPANRVPTLGDIVEVAEQRDGSQGWLTQIRIHGQQDGESGFRGICRQRGQR